MVKLHDTTTALAGSTTAVHSARSNEFVISVQRYQDALLAYRDVARSKETSGSAKASAGQAIHAAFNNMHKKFQSELSMTAFAQKAARSRKGTPLTNSTRAMNIARSSRSIEKLQLVSTIQAGALGQFSKYGKVLGNGLIVIDVGSRIGNVHNSYKADGDWERDLFIESSSFVLSAWAGIIAVRAGSAALMLLTVATPIGWVGLIVTAAAASIITNNIVKIGSGSWYDEIMERVNSW